MCMCEEVRRIGSCLSRKIKDKDAYCYGILDRPAGGGLGRVDK